MTTIAIDLGTSTCAVAALVEGRPRVLAGPEGARVTPTIAARSATGRWEVGQAAKRLAILQPKDIAWDFLRLLGRRLDSAEARNLDALAPFDLVEGASGRACFRLGGEEIDPVVLVAVLLAKLKANAESALRSRVSGAVLGHPPSFDAHQRALLREAARLAELPVRRLATSTSLAALAYEPEFEGDKRVAIFDLGGGGFRASVVELAGQRPRVLSTEWELFLGGEDLDQLLVRRFAEELRREEGVDASADPLILAHLKEAVEKAKCRLSLLERVEVDVPVGGSRLWSKSRARAELEALAAPQLEWLAAPCAKALRAASVSPEELDAVLGFGGGTRMPLVLDTLRECMGVEITLALHPEEAAALGGVVLAERLDGDEAEGPYDEVLHHSIGVEAPPRHFTPIASRGTRLPLKERRSFSTADSRLELKILEGDYEDVRNDLFLGKLVYEVPFRRGATQIEVIVEVDDEGGIEVSSLDVQSGALRKIPLRPGAGWSDTERQRAASEVERFRERLLEESVGSRSRTRRNDPLTPAEKVMAALHGDAETRRRLAADPDRAIWSAALESPKMTAEDALAVASMDVDAEVLRELGADPRWSSSYDFARALVQNPRTPQEVSMRFVDVLAAEDLERVAADERLPGLVRDQCVVLKKMRT